jgi:signal peptidase II
VSASASRAWRLAAGLCVLVAALDQGVKALVEHNLAPGEDVEVLGPLSLTLSHNRGVAFGLADGGGAGLILLAAAALAFVAVLFARDPVRPGMWVAVGLVAGGALGNLIDRLRVGEVTDYVDLPLWPPFNLADAAIVAGVVLLAAVYLQAGEERG